MKTAGEARGAEAAPMHAAAGLPQAIPQVAAAVDDTADDATDEAMSSPAQSCRIALDPECLPLPGMRTVLNLHGHSIAIFGMQDGWRAIADSCPHQGASLAGGKVQDGAVQCPAHGLRFDLATGCLRQAPGLRVAVYPITTGPQGVTIGLPGKD